jgi:hypothetical protein
MFECFCPPIAGLKENFCNKNSSTSINIKLSLKFEKEKLIFANKWAVNVFRQT